MDGFRACPIRPGTPQEVPLGCKAASVDKGCSLGKDGNAAWTYWAGSLRAGRKGVIHSVTSLAKGTTLVGDDAPCG